MKYIIHFELHFQTTRLVEEISHEVDRRSHTKFSLSMTFCFKKLRSTSRSKHSLQITTRTSKKSDFKFELLSLHSSLLRQFLLISFSSLIDMLKFSEYLYLIRDQSLKSIRVVWSTRSERLAKRDVKILLRFKSRWIATRLRARRENEIQYQAVLESCNDARTDMPFEISKSAMCVQRFDDSRNSAIHITYRISLRSSSMSESRDSLLKVLIIRCLLERHW